MKFPWIMMIYPRLQLGGRATAYRTPVPVNPMTATSLLRRRLTVHQARALRMHLFSAQLADSRDDGVHRRLSMSMSPPRPLILTLTLIPKRRPSDGMIWIQHPSTLDQKTTRRTRMSLKTSWTRLFRQLNLVILPGLLNRHLSFPLAVVSPHLTLRLKSGIEPCLRSPQSLLE